MNKLITAVLLACSMILIGCAGENKLTVWTVYWDIEDTANEIERRKNDISSVCFFAAYFDESGELFLPETTAALWEEKKAEYEKNGWINYLSFVNDQRKLGGSASLKDTALLYKLLDTAEKRKAHAEKVIALAEYYGYGGIELDYENIKNDIILWEYYMKFIHEVYLRAEEKGIRVRVLLEPNVPVEKIAWTEGPSYVMMCYNLYGSHSGPGPKADREFLETLISKMKMVPGRADFAIATGGFDWSETGTVQALTEQQALRLLTEKGASAVREEESGSMVFSYLDEKGEKHQVWYADKETLKGWRSQIEEAGDYTVSLWRLGGNKTE